MRTKPFTPEYWQTGRDGRWGTQARWYSWPQCRYCGRAADRDCPKTTCLACGTEQCFGLRTTCMVCLIGWLPGWSRSDKYCGYKGCSNPAVAKAPRVGRCCMGHLARAKSQGMTLAESIAAHVARRDLGGLDWQRLVHFTPEVP